MVRVGACGRSNTDTNIGTAWCFRNAGGLTGNAPAQRTSAADGDRDGAGLRFPGTRGGDVRGAVQEAGEGADASLDGRRVPFGPGRRIIDHPCDSGGAGGPGSERDGGFEESASLRQDGVLPVENELSDAEPATFPAACRTVEYRLDCADTSGEDVALIAGASGGGGLH